MSEIQFRIPTGEERFEVFWQSEQGWALFWDLLQDKESKAADWKRAVENVFCTAFDLGRDTAHKAGK